MKDVIDFASFLTIYRGGILIIVNFLRACPGNNPLLF